MEFQKYIVKEKKKEKKEREREREREKKQGHKNYKEYIGTKLIANTKKHNLKI